MSENIVKLVKDHLESVNKDFADLRAELDSRSVDNDKIAKLESSIAEQHKTIDALNARLNNTGSHDTRSEENLTNDYREILNKKILRSRSFELTDSEKEVVGKFNKIHRGVAVGDANNNTGGYLVPTDNPQGIIEQVRAITPWMMLVETGETSMRDPVRIVQTANFGITRGTETSAASDTSTGTQEEVRGAMGNYEAEPFATEDMLADISFDLVGFINNNIAETISYNVSFDFLQGAATGAGVRGLLDAAAVSSVSDWDSIGVVTATQPTVTLVSGGFGFGLDDLYDTMYGIDMRYRVNPAELSILVPNNGLRNLIKQKDNDGQYLYKPSQSVGDPALFNGVRVVEAPTFANFTQAGDPVALMGNFKKAYTLLKQTTGTKSVVDVLTDKAKTKYYYKDRFAGFYKDLRALRALAAK